MGGLKFDFTINISAITSAFMLMGIIIKYARDVVAYLHSMSIRVNVMWAQFEMDHPDWERRHAAVITQRLETNERYRQP